MAGIKKELRPFRVWDERARRDLPHRSYKSYERATERVLGILVWLAVGNAYTIYDSRNHKALRQWKRAVDGLKEYAE